MINVTTKFVRTAPRKLRLVLDAIKGMPVTSAEAKLAHMPLQAARDTHATLHSAIAAAKDRGFDAESWVVLQAFCDEGPKLKRRVIASRGRARPITKQLSHIHITVGAVNPNGRAAKPSTPKE